jgi:DNA topoisomerase-3
VSLKTKESWNQMAKALYISEKPSVAQEFVKALKLQTKRHDGYIESEEAVITWCVGHLVTMSYPEKYDEKLKKWSLQTLPFIPKEFKYEIIDNVKKQFLTVQSLLHREDIDTVYVCTDSGREGEYIYRLVEQEAHLEGKLRKRVWIDSQTEEEILKGIHTAKDLSECNCQLFKSEVLCCFRRARYDMRSWNGSKKRAGNTRVCKNAVLQSYWNLRMQ